MSRSPAVQPGDEDLVALARNGDHKAFEELVERHKQKAYRIAFDFARDREEAKDLSQEAFLRAYTHLGNFDGRSGFYTWFYRILVNVCLDYKRRKKRTFAGSTGFGRTAVAQSQRRVRRFAAQAEDGVHFEKQPRAFHQRDRGNDADRRGHG